MKQPLFQIATAFLCSFPGFQVRDYTDDFLGRDERGSGRKLIRFYTALQPQNVEVFSRFPPKLQTFPPKSRPHSPAPPAPERAKAAGVSPPLPGRLPGLRPGPKQVEGTILGFDEVGVDRGRKAWIVQLHREIIPAAL
jgi:hypothetical protein